MTKKDEQEKIIRERARKFITEDRCITEGRLLEGFINMYTWGALSEISAKTNKTENLFINLNNAKQQIAEAFSHKYFEDDYHFYWLGEVLSICDEFIDLENIQYALENNIYEPVLFKYLSKPRNFNLEDYCLGKVGRKNKKKKELKKCKENVNYAWEQLQEAIANEHFKQTNKFGK